MVRTIRILSVCLAVFLSGCSSSSTSDSPFNPPEWIQGSWVNSSSFVDVGFKFTTDDIYLIFGDELVPVPLSEDPDALEVTNTDTEYSFKYTLNDKLTLYDCSPVTGQNQIQCTTGSVTSTLTASDNY